MLHGLRGRLSHTLRFLSSRLRVRPEKPSTLLSGLFRALSCPFPPRRYDNLSSNAIGEEGRGPKDKGPGPKSMRGRRCVQASDPLFSTQKAYSTTKNVAAKQSTPRHRYPSKARQLARAGKDRW
jgi:hypothetical protein